MNKQIILGLVCLLAVASLSMACQKNPRVTGRPEPAKTGLTGGKEIFSEDFSKDLANFETRSKLWKIVDGRLYTGDGPNNNQGLWLKAPDLPPNVRIEFDATSVQGNNPVFEGDIKCEFGGKVKEHQDHKLGYVVLFGGWKNSLSAICKGDEHGENQLVKDAAKKVEDNKTYRFQIVKMGNEISWYLNGELYLTVRDPEVLTGHVFGFNNWNSRVYFDNLKIYAL